MPWLAMQFDDERRRKLASRLKVEGYPTLIVFDKGGQPVDTRAVVTIHKGVKEAFQSW